ncbi:MAG TPA: c-type cytochrome [Nocardioidaceae bacterium]|nr:c-type cytochrome [Nocardioidaceae bacterium]
MTTSSRFLLAAAIGSAVLLAGCNQAERVPPMEVVNGNPERGAQLIVDYGCGTCHVIPGIPEANGLVGPPLDHFSRRSFIAGSLRNNAENLQKWISNPQEVEPGTAMPNLGVTSEEATDITAYLYTLE